MMARLIIGDGISIGDIFLPDQLSMFGSIVEHADSTGHLDQVDSFAPEHQIRFDNLEYVTDARGDLIFTGFSASRETPADPEASTSWPLPDPILRSAFVLWPSLSSDASTTSED